MMGPVRRPHHRFVPRLPNAVPSATPASCDNRPMADTTPWPRFKSEVYAFIGRNPRSNRAIASIADLAPHHSVLDIGCGPGAAVRAASSHVARAVGVDRSEAMIAIARRRSDGFPNVEFHTSGVETLPFPERSFDRIWTIHAFHHWEDEDAGLRQCLRVLQPGGRLLVVESETKGKHGLSRNTAGALADRLRELGFASAGVSKPRRQLVVTGEAGR